MVVVPNGSAVVIGGRFLTLNGVAAYGMGSVDSSAGTTTLPWAANKTIRDAGANGAITSLRTDGTQIYGGGYSYGSGTNFEGTFGADPATGAINFVNDCHGDTYDVFPRARCSTRWATRTPASGSAPTRTPTRGRGTSGLPTPRPHPAAVNTGPDDYGWNYSGQPASSVLDWFPTFASGDYTGQNQAGWSLTGNNDYVAYGGEFPLVNNVAQQGLVRFAKASLAPNKSGPVSSSLVAPTTLSYTAGVVRLSWGAAWDKDNANLTYKVYRDTSSTPFYTVDAASTFWSLPSMHVDDTGLVPGSVHTYKLARLRPVRQLRRGSWLPRDRREHHQRIRPGRHQRRCRQLLASR